ncbi:MAG: ATP-binding protein [Thermoleophilia bacterium]
MEKWRVRPDRWLCTPCFQAEMHDSAVRELREAAEFFAERGHLPRRLAQVSLDIFIESPENRAAHAVSRRWLNDPTCNLLINGTVGSGKTFLGVCLARELSGRDLPIPTLFLSVPKLFEAIKAGYNDPGLRESAERLIRWAKEAPILSLDDLGKTHGRDTSWIEEQLYLIVDHRYNNEAPIVITTEFESKGLAARVGLSVVSRLSHGALITSLKTPAEPWRRPREVIS